MSAIRAEQKPRYRELVQRLRSAVTEVVEDGEGYTYTLGEAGITLAEVAEWITLERLCCPFLTFQLEVAGGGLVRLTLRGQEGTKVILREEFHAG